MPSLIDASFDGIIVFTFDLAVNAFGNIINAFAAHAQIGVADFVIDPLLIDADLGCGNAFGMLCTAGIAILAFKTVNTLAVDASLFRAANQIIDPGIVPANAHH